MKPSFHMVHQHYPKAGKREELYALIGWTDLVDNPAFADTCAIRMSMGLLGAGMVLPGARMIANAGSLRGKRLEPGQARLSGILKRVWGAPEVFMEDNSANLGIGVRSGVVSFFRIHGGGPADGGHIDLVWPAGGGFHRCARSCYFSAVEIWFWPLG
ncbi:T6SS effector amidase Tae4 family protein [Massilia jejuensis]|uniref:T6SS effector amidase Tae4 family protein n=1 Tax=Massilia jejuensis TaxID=648894 RepID=A0ABW0PCU5_9BURK